MNDHDLDVALADLGAARVRSRAPSVLRERIATMPLVSKTKRGRLPSIEWRYRSMFSAIKVVVAGAIVALFGGMLVAGGWLQQPEAASNPGAAASTSVTPDLSPPPTRGPIEVTARWRSGDLIRDGDVWSANGVAYQANFAWRATSPEPATDPRLVGRLSMAMNASDYEALGGPMMANFAFRIETNEGAWQMRPSFGFTDANGVAAPVVGIFDGEGAYSGLTAVLALQFHDVSESWDVHGYILDVPLPSDPFPAAGL